jgi:hypothetical protein
MPSLNPFDRDRLAIQNSVADLMRQARERAARRQALERDPTVIGHPNAGAILGMFDVETRDQRAPTLANARAAVGTYRERNVLKALPEFRHSGAAAAAHLGAIAVAAALYSPEVLARNLRAEIARDNLPGVALLVDVAESKREYARPFQVHQALADAMFEGKAKLESVPEVLASNAARDWCDQATRDLDTLEQALNADRPIATLDAYLSTNVFAALAPTEPGAPAAPGGGTTP